MALSPVVTTTTNLPIESVPNARPVSSPLKYLASGSGPASSNGTPKPSVPAPALAAAAAAAAQPPTLDLAEQMNDEEKRKYVKGKLY